VPEPSEENLTKSALVGQTALVPIHDAHAPHYLIRDVSAASGIDTKRLHDNWRPENKGNLKANTGGVYLFDFNRDGILDILVVDVNGSALYQGLPDGKFRDVTAEVGLPTSSDNMAEAVAVADLDGD